MRSKEQLLEQIEEWAKYLDDTAQSSMDVALIVVKEMRRVVHEEKNAQ